MSSITMQDGRQLRLWCALGGLVAAGVAQWLLGSLKFSNAKGEAVFRGLYALSFLANVALVLLARPGAAGPAPWLLLPAGLMLLALWMAVGGRDAQGAIWVLLLPVLHAGLMVVAWVLVAARAGKGRTP
jgi:hypothetical protein